MTVAPRHVGRVIIRGMDRNYTRSAAHLWQRGNQSTGPVIRMNVSR